MPQRGPGPSFGAVPCPPVPSPRTRRRSGCRTGGWTASPAARARSPASCARRVRGVRDDADDCPLARYLSAGLPPGYRVQVGRRRVRLRRPGRGTPVLDRRLPSAAAEFVMAFDAGHHPALERAAARPIDPSTQKEHELSTVTVMAGLAVGIEGFPVTVEANIVPGTPGLHLIGLQGREREVRDRVRAAVINSGFDWPRRRITVTLYPASLTKSWQGLDLAIAASILTAAGALPPDGMDGTVFAAGLGLDRLPAPGAGACPWRWPPPNGERPRSSSRRATPPKPPPSQVFGSSRPGRWTSWANASARPSGCGRPTAARTSRRRTAGRRSRCPASGPGSGRRISPTCRCPPRSGARWRSPPSADTTC
ncbi:magnesium chelatase domain-containing protein [Actinomadura sp. CNU-125]|uniref:magnesium chelatase domain-containing protein n=1 Tax=Actinomadura sp. CNU-125 TaxID=1904961 RepID=UPI0011783437|nr:magnesium chelatase domain-containing protein [Actinomadura sp. CNU-125]